MVPLHGLVKEHSKALVMVIGDCMQDVVGWELHGLCALEACMEVVNPRYTLVPVAKSSLDALAPAGQVESTCIGSAGQVEFSNSEGRLSNDAFTVDANEHNPWIIKANGKQRRNYKVTSVS